MWTKIDVFEILTNSDSPYVIIERQTIFFPPCGIHKRSFAACQSFVKRFYGNRYFGDRSSGIVNRYFGNRYFGDRYSGNQSLVMDLSAIDRSSSTRSSGNRSRSLLTFTNCCNNFSRVRHVIARMRITTLTHVSISPAVRHS